MASLAESAKRSAAAGRRGAPSPAPSRSVSRAGQRRARAICSAGRLASGRRAPAGAGGTMELKKDSNAVSIDMLLIVHSEKRRAAQGAHSDRPADPGAPPQRRGGNPRSGRPRPPAPRPPCPRACPPRGAPGAPGTRSARPNCSPKLAAPQLCGSGVLWQRVAP